MSNDLMARARTCLDDLKVKEALDLLAQLPKASRRVSRLQSRFKSFEKKKLEGTMKAEDERTTWNGIVANIWELIEDLEDEDQSSSNPAPRPTPPKKGIPKKQKKADKDNVEPSTSSQQESAQTHEERKRFILSLESQMTMKYPFPEFYEHDGESDLVSLDYMKQLEVLASSIHQQLDGWQWEYKEDRNEAYRLLYRLQKWLNDLQGRLSRSKNRDAPLFDMIKGIVPVIDKILPTLSSKSVGHHRQIIAKSYLIANRLERIIEDLKINIEIAGAFDS